jgi:ABC-type Mn2+/Zn2+ transport system ATPase subunit
MSYTEKANRSCLEMRVLKQTEMGTVRRQMDGFGGGVSDSISVPLRLMVLKGSDTGDILILDEAFKHVDGDMVEKVGIFLKTIKEKLGTQIIMVTHHKGLLQYADKGFELKNENGSVKN